MEVLVEVGIFPTCGREKQESRAQDEMRMELIRYPFNIMGQKGRNDPIVQEHPFPTTYLISLGNLQF